MSAARCSRRRAPKAQRQRRLFGHDLSAQREEARALMRVPAAIKPGLQCGDLLFGRGAASAACRRALAVPFQPPNLAPDRGRGQHEDASHSHHPQPTGRRAHSRRRLRPITFPR